MGMVEVSLDGSQGLLAYLLGHLTLQVEEVSRSYDFHYYYCFIDAIIAILTVLHGRFFCSWRLGSACRFPVQASEPCCYYAIPIITATEGD